MSLPDSLRSRQILFSKTGGLHGAGLFDRSGGALAVREDVGRHNAVDKLVGWAGLNRRLPLHECALVISGRLGFEIVQKAAMAGILQIVAVSAPSSLAVELAARMGMTVTAFVRGDRANVYCGDGGVTFRV
jgi:FdhD protein